MPPAAPFLPTAEGNVPCPRARVTFGRSPKSDQKRCLKPQVSRLPARLGCAENRGRVPRENQDSADRRTTNRVRSSYRCRSCVPCGGALVYRRGRLSNRALAAVGGKCRCGCRGAGGSDLSAASGGCSEVSEWQRSKFQASAIRQRRNFGHRNSVPFSRARGREILSVGDMEEA